jgi:hypothetical protein
MSGLIGNKFRLGLCRSRLQSSVPSKSIRPVSKTSKSGAHILTRSRYFLFTSVLIILSNEFARLYKNDQYCRQLYHAVGMFECMATTDVQAKRLLYIVTSFRSVIEQMSQANHVVPNSGIMRVNIPARVLPGRRADDTFDSRSSINDQRSESEKQFRTSTTTFSSQDPGMLSSIAANHFDSMPNKGVAQSISARIPNGGSPKSTFTVSSSKTEHSVYAGANGEDSELLSSDQEVDFGSFWDLSTALGSSQTALNPTTYPRSSSGVAFPGAASSHLNIRQHSVAGLPAALSTTGQHPSISSNVPLFRSVDFSGA